jgi:hypothetical protein
MGRSHGLKKFVGRGSKLNVYFLPNFFCSFLKLRGAWPIPPPYIRPLQKSSLLIFVNCYHFKWFTSQ